jgi:transglutaminase-like putative cysteine protease
VEGTLEAYLRRTDILDWDHPSIQALADQLRAASADRVDIARRSFEWVRDEIEHSYDFRRNPVTCHASEVLAEGTGYCFAKSHLLAALLRANGIPAGLCYQRLRMAGPSESFCLHGLNGVHLPKSGWYRLDPRGNKPGINAQFVPPTEQLAFAASQSGEVDLRDVLADPLSCVVEALHEHTTWDAFARHLPDARLAASDAAVT